MSLAISNKILDGSVSIEPNKWKKNVQQAPDYIIRCLLNADNCSSCELSNISGFCTLPHNHELPIVIKELREKYPECLV